MLACMLAEKKTGYIIPKFLDFFTLKMEVTRCSETLVTIYQSTHRNIP